MPPMGHIHQAALRTAWWGAGISTSFHLPHLVCVSHTLTQIATAVAVGLNPCCSCAYPTVHHRTPEIILAFAHSRRMLILSHLLYCTVKSESNSQLLLLLARCSLSSTLRLLCTIHKNLLPITSSNSFLSSVFNYIRSSA